MLDRSPEFCVLSSGLSELPGIDQARASAAYNRTTPRSRSYPGDAGCAKGKGYFSEPFQKVTGLAPQYPGDFNELIDLQGCISYLDSGQLLLFHLDRLRELDLLHVQLRAPVSDPETQFFPIHKST